MTDVRLEVAFCWESKLEFEPANLVVQLLTILFVSAKIDQNRSARPAIVGDKQPLGKIRKRRPAFKDELGGKVNDGEDEQDKAAVGPW